LPDDSISPTIITVIIIIIVLIVLVVGCCCMGDRVREAVVGGSGGVVEAGSSRVLGRSVTAAPGTVRRGTVTKRSRAGSRATGMTEGGPPVVSPGYGKPRSSRRGSRALPPSAASSPALLGSSATMRPTAPTPTRPTTPHYATLHLAPAASATVNRAGWDESAHLDRRSRPQ
jgi:hypothetical protein